MLYLANGAGLLALTSVFALFLLSISRDGARISLPVSGAGIVRSFVAAALPRRPDTGPFRQDRTERDEDARLLTALRRLMETRQDLPRGGAIDRKSRGQARPLRARVAPPDQSPPRLPQLQRLPERLSP